MTLNINYPITQFLQGAALGVTAVAIPGPFQTFLISEAIKRGRHQNLPIAFAPLISDLPIISPGPYLFWLTVTGPILLSALRISTLNTAAFLLGFYGVFIRIF